MGIITMRLTLHLVGILTASLGLPALIHAQETAEPANNGTDPANFVTTQD